MKALTEKEFFNAPALVQFITLQLCANQPIGASLFVEAIKKHPEYFEEEIAAQQKWAAIPEDVKEGYFKELFAAQIAFDHLKPEEIKGGGLLANMKYRDLYNQWYDSVKDKIKALEKGVHDKYLAPYGIKYRAD